MRALTTELLAEITANRMRPILLFEGEFASGFVRVWSGIGEISWDSKTWQGVGLLGGVSPITETGDMKATGIEVTLSGVDAGMLAVAYNEARQGKPGKVWIGGLDDNGVVVVDPFLCFSGKLDVPTDRDDGESATLTISYESRLVDLERPRQRRYTPEDQKIDDPTDKGFDFVTSLQDKQVVWGRA